VLCFVVRVNSHSAWAPCCTETGRFVDRKSTWGKHGLILLLWLCT